MVKDELEKRSELEAVGGLVHLVSLQEDISAIGLIEEHARIVKEKAILRELISSATTIITNCYSQDDKAIEAVLDEAEQLTLRMLASEARVPLQHIRNATVNSDEWMLVTGAAAKLSEMKIFIDDTALQTILDVRTKARKLKADHQIKMLVIDYLQLLSANGRHENRHQEVSAISRALKALAKELAIPIIALSQLSRAVDSRVDKRPMLSDLRESGAIEQDADLIMFLYRDVVYNQETEEPSMAEIIIGKQRNGPTGTVYVTYKREFTTFEEGDFGD